MVRIERQECEQRGIEVAVGCPVGNEGADREEARELFAVERVGRPRAIEEAPGAVEISRHRQGLGFVQGLSGLTGGDAQTKGEHDDVGD
jgi:hypothetical protein